MLFMDTEGILTWDSQQVEERLKMFLDSDTDLPEWNLRCSTGIPDYLADEKTRIDRVSQFDFSRVGHGYAIGRYVRGMITSYVVCSEDFADAELFYSDEIDNYNIRDIAVPLNQSFRYRITYCRGIMMHASAVICNGKAILFTGVSGAGKSTQARLWNEYAGAAVLNFDQVLIFPKKDPMVVCGTPWAGKENLYVPGKYPLGAIVLVEKAGNNKVTELSKGEAFSRIYLNNYLYPLNEEIENRYCDSISRLVAEIPVYGLKCTVTGEPVMCLYRKLFDSNPY